MVQKPCSFVHVLVRYASWMGLIPPACIFIGSTQFGWHLGIGEALHVPHQLAAWVSLAYYVFLLAGFTVAIFLIRWMAPTYGASTDPGVHASLLVTAGAPLMIGGAVHLYPQIGVNLMLLVPALLWSAFLLYTGLPKVLRIDQIAACSWQLPCWAYSLLPLTG